MGNFYNSYSCFLKEKFHKEVYKISLTSNATCPNRDGTLGTGGCIYCSASGSGKVYVKPVYDQVKDFLQSQKNVNRGYIAYFQSFSNMYKNKDEIIKDMKKITEFESIVGFSVATRPDALDNDIMDYLNSIKDRYLIQIELGLETANNITLEKINRKIKAEQYLTAVKQVRERISDCHIVCHVILGLMDENMDDFENTLEIFLRSKSDGIKFHHLFVQKETQLSELFNQGRVRVMSEYEYIDKVLLLLEMIPPSIVIHRMKSSMVPKDLIAPLWTMDRRFFEKLFAYAKEHKSYQGRMYGDNDFNCWKKTV